MMYHILRYIANAEWSNEVGFICNDDQVNKIK